MVDPKIKNAPSQVYISGTSANSRKPSMAAQISLLNSTGSTVDALAIFSYWFIELCPKVPSAAMATSHMKFSVLGQTQTLAATGAQITVSHIDA